MNQYQVKHSYNFHCIRSLHHPNYVAALLSDQSGKMCPGLNLVFLHVNYLQLQLEQTGAVEVCVKRQSLKDPINVTFTISFFFLKRKRKVIEGILTMCRKKLKLYWIWGWIISQKKVNCVQLPNLVTDEKGSYWVRIMTSQCNAVIIFIRKKTKLMLSIITRPCIVLCKA